MTFRYVRMWKCRFAAAARSVHRIAWAGATLVNRNNGTVIFDQIVMLRDVLPDLGNTRPFNTGFVWKRGIVGLVDRFDRTGMAIFENSHGK